MHHRRLAAFLIGSWIAGSLWFAFAVWQNHFLSARLTTGGAPVPGAGDTIQRLGVPIAERLFRYAAEEQTRNFTVTWEWTQVVLALVFAATLYLGTRASRMVLVVCGIMLVLVFFQHFVVTPELTFIGRKLNFSDDPGGGNRTRFWVLQALYGGLEVVKLLLGLGVSIYLFVFKTPARIRTTKSHVGDLPRSASAKL